MTPKTAQPIGVKQLSEKSMKDKYSDRVRVGKTAKDKGKKETK